MLYGSMVCRHKIIVYIVYLGMEELGHSNVFCINLQEIRFFCHFAIAHEYAFQEKEWFPNTTCEMPGLPSASLD